MLLLQPAPAAADLAQAAFTFRNYLVPGASSSAANGVNDSGQIVGHYGDNTGVHGYTYGLNGEPFVTFDFPGAVFTAGDGINASGEVDGEYIDTSGYWHGFTRLAGVFQSVDYPGASATQALGINDAGDVVGNYVYSGRSCDNSPVVSPVCFGFVSSGKTGIFTSLRYPGSTRTQAYGINNKGQIVGTAYYGGTFHSFLYQTGVFTNIDPTGSRASQAVGINDAGTVCGSYVIGNISTGYILSGGVFSRLPNTTIADRVNNKGIVVGEASQNGTVAFVATPALSQPQAPSAAGVSPNYGGGSDQTFTATYIEPNGYQEIGWAMVLFGPVPTGQNACYVQYNEAGNGFYLVSDDGNSSTGPLAPGSAGTLSNSQCVLQGAGTSASGSGDTLTLTLALHFRGSVPATRNVYLWASDRGGPTSGNWQLSGTWSPSSIAPQAPSLSSFAPAAGSGASQVFTANVSDTRGFAAVASAQILINSSLSSVRACYVQYVAAAGGFYLVGDDGASSLGPVAAGTPESVSNSQCVLNGFGSSVSGSGTTMTMKASITFVPAFSGAKNVYFIASDQSGLSMPGWVAAGAWTVSPVIDPPSVLEVSPSAATGSSQFLTAVFQGGGGSSGNISWAMALIKSTVTGANACYVQYSAAANLLYLVSDDGTTSTSLAPGSSGSVENSQCILSGVGTAAMGSGSSLVLTLNLTQKSSFAGVHNIYLWARDFDQNTSGQWRAEGTWTSP
jgi:probable HAF family extracellular repeat protein